MKNEKLFEKKALRAFAAFSGMAAALFAFGLVFAGCDNGSGDTEEINPEVVQIAAGTNISGDDWSRINEDVRIAGKYVILDLSDCTATGNTISGATPPSGNDFNIIRDNEYIKGIILPECLTTIGESAFDGCEYLTGVKIPDSVTSIGYAAFDDCLGLKSINIPSAVTSIGSFAFDDCSGITSVTIPNGVTSIQVYTFHGCKSLKSVTIPNTVTNIGTWAFNGCSGLTSITIPDSVTSIRDNAFDDCTSLTAFKVDGGNNSESAVFFAQDGVLYKNGSPVEIFAVPAALSGEIAIPNGVTGIGNSAFADHSKLTMVTIPNSVETIGFRAFYKCTGLPSVIIPNSVNSIEYGAFQGCSGIPSVTIPDSVDTIGQFAFDGCTKLSSVTFNGGNTVVKYDNIFPSGSSLRNAGSATTDPYKIAAGTYTLSGQTWRKK